MHTREKDKRKNRAVEKIKGKAIPVTGRESP
jgi:hypothetical protein